MPRRAAPLSAADVETAKPGRRCDGGATGLYLLVRGEQRWWSFRYRRSGKLREAGLGSVAVVALAEARDRARELHDLVRRGLDPLAERVILKSQAGS